MSKGLKKFKNEEDDVNIQINRNLAGLEFYTDTHNMCYGDRPMACFLEKEKGMRKVYIFFLFCILLIQSGFSKTKNELNIFNNLNSPEIIINNIQIEDDKSQMLINEFNSSRIKGLTKCLCLFEIEIKTDNDIIKLKSNGGKLFAFADNDIFFEMNTDLINYINLTNISFIYKGSKYIITPNKNNNVIVSTEWNTKNIELSSFSYKILFTANGNRNEENISKNVNESSCIFYYGNNTKISFNLFEVESLFLELQKIVELFNMEK